MGSRKFDFLIFWKNGFSMSAGPISFGSANILITFKVLPFDCQEPRPVLPFDNLQGLTANASLRLSRFTVHIIQYPLLLLQLILSALSPGDDGEHLRKVSL
jgi:hypothetical protein